MGIRGFIAKQWRRGGNYIPPFTRRVLWERLTAQQKIQESKQYVLKVKQLQTSVESVSVQLIGFQGLNIFSVI